MLDPPLRYPRQRELFNGGAGDSSMSKVADGVSRWRMAAVGAVTVRPAAGVSLVEQPPDVTAHLALVGDVEGERVVEVAHPDGDRAVSVGAGVAQQDVEDLGQAAARHCDVPWHVTAGVLKAPALGSTTTLDVTMASLRRCLTDALRTAARPARLPRIATLRGHGYRPGACRGADKFSADGGA